MSTKCPHNMVNLAH